MGWILAEPVLLLLPLSLADLLAVLWLLVLLLPASAIKGLIARHSGGSHPRCTVYGALP